MPDWQKLMIGIDVVLGVCLIALEVLTLKKYKKRKAANTTVTE